ncbi:MAG: nucleotidyltransferase domain-containing protein [Deltaproteobacteria bacterium]|nr:nucleotidyltransferase domain-containing protein [Deltaproteobacteria bacterium]
MIEPRLHRVTAAIEAYYGPRLLAVALFGSRVGSRARVDSDWDLLVVLVPKDPIRRDLYREWDAQVASGIHAVLPGVSPHFVHLPGPDAEPSSLWLEVSERHAILTDPGNRLAAFLGHVRGLVDTGRFERRSVHGVSYWRRAG